MSRADHYTFLVCETAEQIAAAQRLRYEVYCLEKGWIDPEKCDGETETDDCDEGAVHFLALRDGFPVGTARYLLASKCELPAARFLPLDRFDAEPEQIAEVSRLATLARHGRSQNPYVFIKMTLLMWEWAMERSVKVWLAVVDVPLYHLIMRMGMPVIDVGEEAYYLGSRCVPMAFDMAGTGPALRRRLPADERATVTAES